MKIDANHVILFMVGVGVGLILTALEVPMFMIVSAAALIMAVYTFLSENDKVRAIVVKVLLAIWSVLWFIIKYISLGLYHVGKFIWRGLSFIGKYIWSRRSANSRLAYKVGSNYLDQIKEEEELNAPIVPITELIEEPIVEEVNEPVIEDKKEPIVEEINEPVVEEIKEEQTNSSQNESTEENQETDSIPEFPLMSDGETRFTKFLSQYIEDEDDISDEDWATLEKFEETLSIEHREAMLKNQKEEE